MSLGYDYFMRFESEVWKCGSVAIFLQSKHNIHKLIQITHSMLKFFSGVLIGSAFGFGIGALRTPGLKRSIKALAARQMQLIAARNEMLCYRRKNKRPYLSIWQKILLSSLYSYSPILTSFNTFKPATLIGWHRRFVKQWWKHLSKPKTSKRGRRKINPEIENLVLAIKAENPDYGIDRIAVLLQKQIGISITATTVGNILKRNNYILPPPKRSSMSWKTFFRHYRYVMASMDFKVVFDFRTRPLFILNIIDHARRELILCKATYHPTSEWVSQQLRNAYPFNEAPKNMLMDRDSIFLPVAKETLPSMGVNVMKTAPKSPWQNGIVERFNRTLTEELLNHIIPLNEWHLNDLLQQYQTFYNTARPHQANDGDPPCLMPISLNNCIRNIGGKGDIESIPWLGGLHHSYRAAA